jgi:signal transduction histidine kinase
VAQGFVRNLEVDYVNEEGRCTPIEINATVLSTGKNLRILTLCRDISRRKNAEDRLRRLLDFDELINALLGRFASATMAEVDEQIRSSLKQVGLFIGVDNVFVVLASEDMSTWSSVYSWTRPGFPDTQPHYQQMPMGTIAWSERILLGDEILRINRLDELPPEAATDRAVYKREGVKSLLMVPLRGKEGRIHGCVGLWSFSRQITWIEEDSRRLHILSETIANVLERKQAEEALQKAHEELEQKVKDRTAKLRALAVQLDRAEEKERQRIAQILHDDLQQIISGARFTLVGLRDTASKAGQQSILEKTDDYLEKAHQIMRALCLDLHPPVLHEVGVGAALHWLKGDMQEKFGLTVEVTVDKSVEPTTANVRSFVFQSARELLFNVAKHARVKSAQVRLERLDADWMMIEVKDQGVGFDPERVKPNSYGLFSIRERVDYVGGQMKIVSAPGKGASIRLTLPRL